MEYSKFIYYFCIVFIKYKILNMKKILVTENQFDMIRKGLNENEENRFKNEVSIHVRGNGGMYDGIEIDDVRTSYNHKMVLSYSIQEDYRSWGIEGIYIHNIKGPSELEVTLIGYEEGSNDPIEKDITIPLNWEEDLHVEDMGNQGQISINDYVDIVLYFRENNVIEVEISLDVYTL